MSHETERDKPIEVRDANSVTQKVDNKQVTNEFDERVLRQQVRDPDANDTLAQILVALTQILSRQGLPNPSTGNVRVQLAAIDAALTLATVTTVTAVTSVTSVAGFGGLNPAAVALDPYFQQAAAQRRFLEVGLWP